MNQGIIEAGKLLITAVGPAIIKKAKHYWETDHGSKVKSGLYAEKSIELIDDKACIVVDEDAGDVVYLTSDTVKSLKFDKEKYRIKAGHTYYYYYIMFKNDKQSYVRMRRKYRDAMLNECK